MKWMLSRFRVDRHGSVAIQYVLLALSGGAAALFALTVASRLFGLSSSGSGLEQQDVSPLSNTESPAGNRQLTKQTPEAR